MKTSVKTLLILSALSTSVAFTNALAADASSSSGDSTGTSSSSASQAQMNILADIDGVLHATAKVASSMTNQLDQFISRIESSNTAPSNLSNSATLYSHSYDISSSDIASDSSYHTLYLKPTSMDNYINFDANTMSYGNAGSTLARNNATMNGTSFTVTSGTTNAYVNGLIKNSPSISSEVSGSSSSSISSTKLPLSTIQSLMSTYTPASDSIFVAGASDISSSYTDCTDCASSSQLNTVARQEENFNTYLTGATFFSPYNGSYFINSDSSSSSSSDNNTAYSSNAAKAYLAYLTGAFYPIGASVDWGALSSITTQSSGSTDTTASVRAKDIYNVKTNAVFKLYQLNMRRMVAIHSGMESVLNYLYNERKPSQSLAKQAHMPTEYTTTNYVSSSDSSSSSSSSSTGQKVITASPLQYENYKANQRVNSPQWYQAMSTASPATVQRETLYVMAEILSKMQQAHMDRERQMYLQILQMNLSNSALGSTLKSQADAVNEYIGSLPGVSTTSTGTPSTETSQTDAALNTALNTQRQP